MSDKKTAARTAKKLTTRQLVTLSALIAVAMILSYVESMIPAFVAVPGVKVGLSNIATVFALYALGWPYAICVSVVRVFLSALLFGNFVSLIYSLSGAALALVSMILLKKPTKILEIGAAVGYSSSFFAFLRLASALLAVCVTTSARSSLPA